MSNVYLIAEVGHLDRTRTSGIELLETSDQDAYGVKLTLRLFSCTYYTGKISMCFETG